VLSNRRFKGPEVLPFFPSVEQICCPAFPRAKPYTESTASSADYSQSLGGSSKSMGKILVGAMEPGLNLSICSTVNA